MDTKQLRPDLERFVSAQAGGQYEQALAEMTNGMKTNHWIWYVFPQIKGLGHSSLSRYYGIQDLQEARDYLTHPVLGARLREITAAVLQHKGRNITFIMGSSIDAMKLRSSMTLFDLVCPHDLFSQVLDTFFDGKRDGMTLKRTKPTA